MARYETITGTDIAAAAAWLRRGACVAIPTETVYGLAANALDPEAVVEIFSVKNRPSFDPLIVHVTHPADLTDLVSEIPQVARQLMDAFWPGPLTLLLPKTDRVPDIVTSGLPRVALRAPAHPMARALLSALDFPLAAPSANPFGYISPTTARHVSDQLSGKIPYILDGGPCSVGVESTIVGFEPEGMVVYRLGGLSVEQLTAIGGPLRLELHQGSNPAAPGMLDTHYAPRKPLQAGHFSQHAGQLLFKGKSLPTDRSIALILFSPRPGLQLAPNIVVTEILSENADPAEAARRLFAVLRQLDQSDADLLLAEWAPESGLGSAINDRLRRASTP